jgi:hypothetical protein
MPKMKYVIGTNSRLLAEFSQCPEGMAKVLLIVTLPFWGISWLIRKASGDTIKDTKGEKIR